MTTDIIRKLAAELQRGITTEGQVVYLLAGLRKLLEQQQAKQKYADLTFHCDWTLHSKLEGTAAQKILKQFDAANIHLKAGTKLHALPWDLQREIDRISQMESFREELSGFLLANGLQTLESHRSDGWVHFLHLYAKVVEDCPLVMKTKKDSLSSIDMVTVHMELAKEPVEDEMPFKVTWTVSDKNRLSGHIFLINSFSLAP